MVQTYNKLVRDKIPERIEKRGEPFATHVADDLEYHKKLFEKLSEEIEEFKAEESLKELADVLEVIDAIIAFKQFDRAELAEIKEKKKEERGGFEKRIILEES